MLVVILFNDLLAKPVINASLQNVWIITGSHFTSAGSKPSSVLSQKLDMFLCGISGFVDLLRTLTGTTGELLRFVLDFLVQAIEDRENGTLGVLSHVLEKACNSTQVLVKVMTFLQWVRNCL